MNNKIVNKKLLKLLSKGKINNEKEFRIFYNAHDEIISLPNKGNYKIRTVAIRLHLFGGYCQVTVLEKPHRFSTSLFGFYESQDQPLKIEFYNYDDCKFASYKEMRTAHMQAELEKLKNTYIGMEMTIEELYCKCEFECEFYEQLSYYDYLESKWILFGFFELDHKTTIPVRFCFEVLEDYSMLTSDAWEALRTIKIKVTDVKLWVQEVHINEFYV